MGVIHVLRRCRHWRSHPTVSGRLLQRYRRQRSISFSTSGGGIPPLVLVLVLVRVVPTQWWGVVQLSWLRGFQLSIPPFVCVVVGFPHGMVVAFRRWVIGWCGSGCWVVPELAGRC